MAITTKTAAALIQGSHSETAHTQNADPDNVKIFQPITVQPKYLKTNITPDNPGEYNEAPDFLQEAVNLSIELRAATREIEALKTFLKEIHLLVAFQEWREEQQADQNEE